MPVAELGARRSPSPALTQPCQPGHRCGVLGERVELDDPQVASWPDPASRRPPGAPEYPRTAHALAARTRRTAGWGPCSSSGSSSRPHVREPVERVPAGRPPRREPGRPPGRRARTRSGTPSAATWPARAPATSSPGCASSGWTTAAPWRSRTSSPRPRAPPAGPSEAAPGNPDDGVVWDIVTDAAYEQVRPSWTFYAFLTLATMIASIAVIEDSSILVVGRHGGRPGVRRRVRRRARPRDARAAPGRRRRSSCWCSASPSAILITAAFALLWAALGWIDSDTLTAPRPQTGLHLAARPLVPRRRRAGRDRRHAVPDGRAHRRPGRGVHLGHHRARRPGTWPWRWPWPTRRELRGSAAQLLINLDRDDRGRHASSCVLQRWIWRRWGRLVRFNSRGRLVRPGG